jgi:hypothetical protein
MRSVQWVVYSAKHLVLSDRMPEGVVEKQPDRAAIWTFQEAEAVSGSEVISFNSRVNGKDNTLQQQDRNLYITAKCYILGQWLPKTATFDAALSAEKIVEYLPQISIVRPIFIAFFSALARLNAKVRGQKSEAIRQTGARSRRDTTAVRQFSH